MHREELLEWLKEYMVQHPISIEKLAQKIGINRLTLKAFYREDKETSLQSLLMIEKFLRDSDEDAPCCDYWPCDCLHKNLMEVSGVSEELKGPIVNFGKDHSAISDDFERITPPEMPTLKRRFLKEQE